MFLTVLVLIQINLIVLLSNSYSVNCYFVVCKQHIFYNCKTKTINVKPVKPLNGLYLLMKTFILVFSLQSWCSIGNTFIIITKNVMKFNTYNINCTTWKINYKHQTPPMKSHTNKATNNKWSRQHKLLQSHHVVGWNLFHTCTPNIILCPSRPPFKILKNNKNSSQSSYKTDEQEFELRRQ